MRDDQTRNAPAIYELNSRIIDCVRCPRLAAYIREVAVTKRKAFRDEQYWGRPVPNFGDPEARIVVAGLAPAAHGGNRTGRMFTGDESGNWLYRAMYETGLASHPTSVDASDGLTLTNSYITAAAHCAPPANKPTREELTTCRSWVVETLGLLDWRVLVALGRIGFEQSLAALKQMGERKLPKRAEFAHGAELKLDGDRWIVCSYHPSQQNTYTGKLTSEMLRSVFEAAVRLQSYPRSG